MFNVIESIGRSVIVTDVTYEEYSEFYEWAEGTSMLDYPTLFPSDKAGTAMMYVCASMGCGGGRWIGVLLPLIEARFPGRIIHEVDFEKED